MFRFLYKRMLLAYLLLVDQFKTSKRTLEEKYQPKLHSNQPILVRHNGSYLIILNNWKEKNFKVEDLEVSISNQPDKDFECTSFQVNDLQIVLSNRISTKRIYVQLKYKNQQITLGEQLLDLKGTVNFRDVGHYFTVNNQQVKLNKLFRSGHLYKLHRSEHDYFSSLNITTIIDFRGHGMVKRFPDRVPNAENIKFAHLPIESKGLEMKKLGRKILKDDLADFDATVILAKAYKNFITHSTPEVKAVFKILLEAENGVLMHCSAGKDRTGFFIALILKTLGVDHDVIFQDYIASNFFRKKENDNLARKAQLFTDPAPLLPLLNVQADYLKAAFDEMDLQFGSFENYLMDEIGLSSDDIDHLRKKYLRN